MLQHGWALPAKSSRHRIANTTEVYSQAGSRLATETGGGGEERDGEGGLFNEYRVTVRNDEKVLGKVTQYHECPSCPTNGQV